MEKPLRRTLEELIEARTTRRDAMKGILAAGGAMTAVWCMPNHASANPTFTDETAAPDDSDFDALPHIKDAEQPEIARSIGVAEGYQTRVLISWGDPMFKDAKRMDFHRPTADGQLQQFGYNNDFIAYMPLEKGTDSSH